MTAADGAAGAMGVVPRDYNFAADVLARNLAAGRADKPAYIDGHRTLTYRQLADRVARFAAALRGLGLRREERVLIALTDTIDWPTAFLGCLKAGIIAVPVNTLLTEDDYRFMLADSRAESYAARTMALDAARKRDQGENVTMEASCAKLFASEMVGRVADRAVQIFGGAGYTSDHGIERLYRDVRIFRIYEGTSEIQRLVIAREMMKRV